MTTEFVISDGVTGFRPLTRAAGRVSTQTAEVDVKTIAEHKNTLPPRQRSEHDGMVGSCDIPEQRYGTVPAVEIELAIYPPRFSTVHGALLVRHILRQAGGRPGPVLNWVIAQANRYFAAFPTWTNEDCEHSAALDLLLWQRAGGVKSSTRWHAAREIVELLETFEEVANTMKETNK